ncbi:autotransporter domain-containing protein [Seleniivibrio sp.]|uniref:autotransporter outer membrane beta-barrel domain-containing protein n=1 Tax=Seleniivibrio sp. TaxID=2898801 RepID=UPI0025D84ACC|nr:autotransporter domain-containing protein [Seleniivibrio sp.]MCD8553505.1 autotransporter domain-containing protein [Seleniivibrio sp.]
MNRFLKSSSGQVPPFSKFIVMAIIAFAALNAVPAYSDTISSSTDVSVSVFAGNYDFIELRTDNDSVSDITQTLILSGNTTINNPTYSGVIMQTNSANRDAIVSIGSDVSITSNGGFGAVWVRNDTSGDITITNNGTAIANATGGPGITATTNLGSVVIVNNGSSTSVDNWGIYGDGGYNNTSADPATVSLTNTGTVTSYLAGMRAINYQGYAYINNSGTVESATRQGLVAWSDDGNVGIENTGSVTSGDDSAIHAMSENGDIIVVNEGTLTASDDDLIVATRAGYAGILAYSEYTGDIGIVNTEDGIINAADDFGISAEATAGKVSIVNIGTINALSGVTGTAADGAVEIVNAGTVTATTKGIVLNGSTNYLVNVGSITVSSGAAIETGDGDTTIINEGTIDSGSSDNVAIAFGDGDNRLVIDANSVIVGKVTSGTGVTTLELSGAGTLDTDLISDTGQYQGFDNVEKTGDGTWEITGDSDNVNWSIYGGSLSINGSVKNVDVYGGTLSGSGNYGDIVVDSGGVLAPGNSIGTMNVTDVTFSTGSTYEVEIDKDGSSDKVNATGTVTIESGSTINVLAEDGTSDGSDYDPYTKYTIITSEDGITGTFDTVTDSFAFLDVYLQYDENNVYIELLRNNMDFTSYAKTSNQAGVAKALGTLGIDSPLYKAVLPLSEAKVADAFSMLSGEAYVSVQTMLLDDSRFVRDAVLSRAPIETGSYRFWFNAFGAKADWEGNSGTSTLSRTIGGLIVGAEKAINTTTSAGLVFGAENTDYDVDSLSSSGSVKSYYLGAYAEKLINDITLTFGAAYGWHNIDADRTVSFGSLSEQQDADYDADSYQFFGEISYDIKDGNSKVTPFLNAAYVKLDTDGFSEDGGSSALRGDSSDMDTVFATAGLRVETQTVLGGLKLKPNGSVGLKHSFGDRTPETTVALEGADAFTTEGTPIARDTVVFELGVDSSVSARTSVGVAYKGNFAGESTDQSINADLTIRF